MRRSRRIQLKIPIAVVSLKPDTLFSERCETVVVDEHGRGLRPPTLPCGIPVRLELLPGKRIVTGRIAGSSPVGSDETLWILGVELDEPWKYLWSHEPANGLEIGRRRQAAKVLHSLHEELDQLTRNSIDPLQRAFGETMQFFPPAV